ncbi:MAG TPA: FAD-dependent oxidoreductase, partial [Candidatus Caenarcaniphilales bacterium]
YELSQVPHLAVTVFDRRRPETWEATGAALGVLIAALSWKLKGLNLQLRAASLKRYETLVPELEVLTGAKIPFNQQGILRLCFDDAELIQWQKLAAARSSQGFPLQILGVDEVSARYPSIRCASNLETQRPFIGAVYSPQDRQVDPVALSQALIRAAQCRGALFHFGTQVQGFTWATRQENRQVEQIQTDAGDFPVDWLVLASGLGSTLLSTTLQQPLNIQPVLGQALHLRLGQPLAQLYPVIQGAEVHLVPVNATELWVGATVEFPADEQSAARLQPSFQKLEVVRQQAIALCPALADAVTIRTWSGLRPRPQGRPAPVINPLPGYRNVLLATGHYRNGVLLAPVTAEKIRELITLLSAE